MTYFFTAFFLLLLICSATYYSLSPTTTTTILRIYTFIIFSTSYLSHSCSYTQISYCTHYISDMTDQNNHIPRLKLVDFSLRITAIPLSIASLCLTLTNNEDNPDYGSIRYLSFTGLQYMVAVAGIAAVYAFVAAISIWIRCLVNRTWVFFVSDQVMAYLMVTSVGAGAELMYLAYKGDVEVSWSESCTAYGSFCSKLKTALVLHFLALFCFLVLAVISAFRAFTMFDPPLTLHQQVDQQHGT